MLKDFSIVKQQLFAPELPFHTPFFELSEEVCNILEKEITDYRPADKKGNPGALLDFRHNQLPTIIVPDIHARPEFIYKILNYKLDQSIIDYSDKTVFHALKKGLVRIICVGDALHTEKNYHRWSQIQAEFKGGITTGSCMSQEMLEGLNSILALMKLKTLFPENVHFLKGNHENIQNKIGGGDYAFRKYADEGNMVKKFLFDMYGDDVIYMLSCIENALPLICVNKNYLISHAEPKNAYTRDQLINAREESLIVEGLTWTNNDAAVEGSVAGIAKNLLEMEEEENWYYFGGHRPVPENYLLRQNNKYVQFHNPSKQNIIMIMPDEKIELEKVLKNLDKRRRK